MAVRKDRDAKTESNRPNQACEVLAETGIRVARNGPPSTFANRRLNFA
jgi:hypothetical protein